MAEFKDPTTTPAGADMEKEKINVSLNFNLKDIHGSHLGSSVESFSGNNLQEVYRQIASFLVGIEMDPSRADLIVDNATITMGDQKMTWSEFEKQASA